MKRTMFVLAALALPFTAACSGSGSSKPVQEETLTETCVRETTALYERHNLPTTKPESEWAGSCDAFMAEHNITTKAELVVAIREADHYLGNLNK